MSDSCSVTSVQTFSITENENTVLEYDPAYLQKLVEAHEKKIQRQRVYYQKVKDTEEYKEKRRIQQRNRRDKIKLEKSNSSKTEEGK